MTPQEHIKRLEQELAELKASLETKRNPQEPPFKQGDEYYCLNHYGHVVSYAWLDKGIDRATWQQGNAFATKEEAERKSKRDRLDAYLRHCEGARNFVVDKQNWHIRWECSDYKVFFCPDFRSHQYSTVYFDTEANAQAAFDNIPEDLLPVFKGEM